MASDGDGIHEEVVERGKSALVAVREHGGLAIPAAVGLGAAVAAAAGPKLVRSLSSRMEEKGDEAAKRLGEHAAQGARGGTGGGGFAGTLLSKALGGSSNGGDGDGGGGGGKKTRRLPIQRWTDVAVPVDRAYEAWLQFDQYPKFMHRVLSVEQKGDNQLNWQEKIWFSKRQWQGQITDQRKNDRIAWKTTSGMSHKGIVSFHKLDDKLTRVMVDMEFEPTGMLEKMASGLRFVKRAVQADLARFKAYVEMQDTKGIDYFDSDEAADEPIARERRSQSANASERDSGRKQRQGARDQRKRQGSSR